MNEFFQISAFAGVTLSLVAYMIGVFLKKKTKLAIFNPLMISIVVTIIVLIVSKTDYEVYNEGAKYLSWLLTPATVCLAIPLYEQIDLLKKNYKAVFAGILSGVLTSLVTVFVLAKLMKLNHTEYITLPSSNFLTNPSPPALPPFIASVSSLFYHFQLPFYSVSPASSPVSPGLVLSDAKVGRRA